MDIRPTSDRLRETLFNVLCAGDPEALAGSTWIDLYAGTGAVGIEAISRGAAVVYFVESSKAAAEVIAANLKSLGVARGVQVVKTETTKALRQMEAQGVVADFVFLDPPYRLRDEYAHTLSALGTSRLLGQQCIVIAEHEERFDPSSEYGALQRYRRLDQGDVTLSFYSKREPLNYT